MGKRSEMLDSSRRSARLSVQFDAFVFWKMVFHSHGCKLIGGDKMTRNPDGTWSVTDSEINVLLCDLDDAEAWNREHGYRSIALRIEHDRDILYSALCASGFYERD